MTDLIKPKFGEIHLSTGEMEMFTHLRKMFGISEQQALDEVIEYKRDQAILHGRNGHLALAKQLLKEIGQWNDDWEDAKLEQLLLPDPSIVAK